MVYLLVNERCATLVIMDMKTMSHIAKKEFNLLNLRNLVGIGFAVTSSFTYRYRAFRRCQTKTSVGGFCVLYIYLKYEHE